MRYRIQVIEQVSFLPEPIGLALELQPKMNISDIKSITIHSYNNAVSSPSDAPEKWAPKTRESADHSIPFTVAAALRDGQVTPTTFTSNSISDPNLVKIIEKITIKENPDFTLRYSDEYNCHMEIITHSGQSFVAKTSFPKGHRNNPLNNAELDTKFCKLAIPTITEQQCEKTLSLLWTAENLPNLDEVFDSLVV